MSLWTYWCNEQISKDDGIYNICSRKTAIWDFCEQGLVPFLKQHGYPFAKNMPDLHLAVLRLLFAIYEGKHVEPVPSPFSGTEHYDMYCFRVGSVEWQSFWTAWGQLDDFQGYATSFQYRLPEFVWSWLDIERSTTFKAIEDEIEEQEEEAKGKDDPYLAETSRRDYQDRHW